MKKYHFLNINPFNMIVLKLHFIKQFQNNISLWVEVGIKGYVYFQALKRHFLAKIMFF